MAWWDSYTDATPVVMGHYWRRPVVPTPDALAALTPEEAGLFGHTPPFAWHGQRHNVFCVDYSVGGRWLDRLRGDDPVRRSKLAAMRWPERVLVFDDGTQAISENFEHSVALRD